MKLFFSLLVIILLSLDINCQNNAEHIPWKLKGAEKRIEQYRKGDAKLKFILNDTSIQLSKSKLSINLSKHDFKFGVSMTQARRLYRTKDYEEYLSKLDDVFNYTTLGLYWYLTDERNNYYHNVEEYLENVIKWLKNKNITIKGHPLIWHESLPKWVRNFKDMDELDKLIKDRIKNLILKYPQIEHWDVYNEPVAPFKNHVESNGVTRWVKYKGGIYPTMIELYNLVNEIDSLKYYTNNHYNAKDPDFYKLNDFFVEEGINFQAIGIQAHMQTDDNILSEKELWNILEDYSIFGKDIQLTEVTVTSSKRFKNWKDHQIFLKKRENQDINEKKITLPSLPEYEDFQANYLKDFYTLAFSHPSVSSITFWNLTDRNAWRGHAGGLLFEDLEPKKAYLMLKNLIKKEWSTNVSAEIDLSKDFSFNGFYGQYLGEISIEGENYLFSFHHSRNNKEILEIPLNRVYEK